MQIHCNGIRGLAVIVMIVHLLTVTDECNKNCWRAAGNICSMATSEQCVCVEKFEVCMCWCVCMEGGIKGGGWRGGVRGNAHVLVISVK